MKFREPLESADLLLMLKWRVVKITHWTMDYIDSLSVGRLFEFIQIEDGMNKARGT